MSKKDLSNASEKETYYNSESEGKEKCDQYIQATGEETYGKEFWEEYHNNTKEKKNNS
jgi:hypothetical protein